MKKRNQYEHIIGVDEAGRGPLAGPLSVALVQIRPQLLRSLGRIPDSKQLSAEKRSEWYRYLIKSRRNQELFFTSVFISPQDIDIRGMSWALTRALTLLFSRIHSSPDETRVLLDGTLKAPARFLYQETIIGGDAKETAIALASIVAKVRRDRYMERIAPAYPQYSFERHKGYGTKEHQKLLILHGPSPIHRKTFITRLTR